MLPTIDMTLQHVYHTGWFGDIDIGEQFVLNLPLDKILITYAGIDATELKPRLGEASYIPTSILEGSRRL